MRSWTRLLPARRKPLVFSGTSNPELAQRIADRLGTRLGPIEHETFGNGETYALRRRAAQASDGSSTPDGSALSSTSTATKPAASSAPTECSSEMES
jgi:hypothetical protein